VLGQIDDAEARFALNKARIELENSKKQAGNDIKVRFAKKSSEVAEAEVKRALASLEKFAKSVSETELDRLKLTAQKAVLEIEQAQHDFEIVQFTKEVNENQVELAESNVSRRKITAPIAGVVVQVYKHRGEWIEPGKSVLRILRIDTLRAEGFVKADDVKGDLTGRKASLVASIPDKGKMEFTGKVVFVSPEINPVNGQVRVWAEIENKGMLLRPGMQATLSIDTSSSATAAR
jgi:macrolide-specific efflux system membrane fusion protein